MSNFLTSGSMSDTERALLLQEADTQHIKSDFNFLNEHKGWRPGKVATVVAPTHSGKSTLTRSLVWDYLINNEMPYNKCFVWLSEETSEAFKQELAKLGIPKEHLDRLIIGSEQDIHNGLNHMKMLFAESLKEVCPEIVFFDNVTTSAFYAGKRPEEQASFAMFLKRMAIEENLPMVLIAHTGGATMMNKRLLELNDIRGGKDIVNITEFAYILQRFRVINPETNKECYFPTIRIEKHRGYICDNLLFELKFNPKTVSFMQDRAIPWQEFKDAFNNQLTL